MAFKKTFRPRRRFRRRGRGRKFMSRGLARKRHNASDTKMFYFKTNATATTNLSGQYFKSHGARALTQDPGDWPQFTLLKSIYDQFKCIAIKVRYFPANVGIEPYASTIPIVNPTYRGNTIVWNDQRADSLLPPVTIGAIINNASARIMNSRRSFSRSIYRSGGFDTWGNIQSVATQDSWNGSINIFIDDATPATVLEAPNLWYWTAQYKVIFRGRRST